MCVDGWRARRGWRYDLDTPHDNRPSRSRRPRTQPLRHARRPGRRGHVLDCALGFQSLSRDSLHQRRPDRGHVCRHPAARHSGDGTHGSTAHPRPPRSCARRTARGLRAHADTGRGRGAVRRARHHRRRPTHAHRAAWAVAVCGARDRRRECLMRQVLIALDQLANAILAGHAGETLSARSSTTL